MEQRYLDYFAKNIKHLCINQDVKQESLATLSKVTKSYLSKIESLTIRTNDEVLLKIYKALHHELIINENKLSKMDDELEHFHHDMVFCNKKESKKTFHKLVTEKEKYLYSPELIKYCLYIYQCINMIGDERDLLIDLDNYLDKLSKMIPFNNRELQIFYDCKGVYLMNQSKYNEASKSFNKSFTYGIYSDVTSMAYYHAAKSFYYLNKLLDSFAINKKALERFSEENNYTRIWFVQNHISIIYYRCKDYDKASSIECSLLEANGMEQYKDKLRRNIAWHLINKNKYQEALKLLLKKDVLKKFTPICYFYVSWCYYQLSDYERSLKFVNEGLVVVTNDQVLETKLRINKALIEVQDKSVVKTICTEYNRVKSKLNSEDKEFILKIIIENAEKNCMYKLANENYQTLIK